MSDYLAPTPVWAPTDVGAFVLTTTHLDCLGLDERLRTGLLAWQAYFDEHHPVDLCGWDSPSARTHYACEGFRLHEALQSALPGIWVDLDLWPVPDAEADLDAELGTSRV